MLFSRVRLLDPNDKDVLSEIGYGRAEKVNGVAADISMAAEHTKPIEVLRKTDTAAIHRLRPPHDDGN